MLITRWIASDCGVESTGTSMEHVDSLCSTPPSKPTRDIVLAPVSFANRTVLARSARTGSP